MASLLKTAAALISSPVERRLFAEYGAIFATTATPPPVLIFTDAAQVESFQSSLAIKSAVFGDHQIELQTIALDALTAAASEMAEQGGSITARAADSGGRSYEDTVRLWTRNVTRGIEHWQRLNRMSQEQADSLLGLTAAEQVAPILSLEDGEHLFFGTFFDKSILYSVAAPGASQHLSMLAFDVAEYQDHAVERMLGRHGWYRTVPNDLPHFTFIGHEEAELRGLGLHRIERTHPDRMYDFWTPDLDRL